MLKTAKIDKLMVVTDFDATLTTGKSIQCHDLVGFSPLMSQAFRDEFAPLLDWQSNAAIDGVEWWDTAHALMVKHGQPQRQTLPRMVREAKMEWRAGALDLLERLAALQVPVPTSRPASPTSSRSSSARRARGAILARGARRNSGLRRRPFPTRGSTRRGPRTSRSARTV